MKSSLTVLATVLVALPKKPGGRRPWQAAFLIAAALAQAWEVLAGCGID